MTNNDTILRFHNVTKSFHVGSAPLIGHRATVVAVRDFSLSVHAGEIVGLVGQSGAGKTTVGRLALGLERPDRGDIAFEGESLVARSRRQLRPIRQRMHMIFQDPYQSLHPSMRIWELVAEPLEIAGVRRLQRRAAAQRALETVKMTPSSQYLDRFAHELSGGQRQRVAFARAQIGAPRLVVADEPTSMLDVSLRAGILELVLQFREGGHNGVLYITHDLAVARHICDRIAVMQAGGLVELGAADQIINQPTHPYTRRLLQAATNIGHG
ncbi:MAG TPA: ABC transporter ATP-binding protein [Nitriliruptorales bacterium]|nr:ABC transporter ATP-binding protein [Nitriliruptorales bacterium]